MKKYGLLKENKIVGYVYGDEHKFTKENAIQVWFKNEIVTLVKGELFQIAENTYHVKLN